jgi:hypothetical protein
MDEQGRLFLPETLPHGWKVGEIQFWPRKRPHEPLGSVRCSRAHDPTSD